MGNKMGTYTLANGMEIPKMGFGCYNPNKGADNRRIITDAMEVGYRYFDTASLYETERDLGAAIRDAGMNRKDLFIVSKAWTDELGYQETKEAFYRSLERIGTDYLDLYLIHWPRAVEGDTDWKEKDLASWRAMEELQKEGLVRGLGLSNFLPHHLDNILKNASVKPVVDQLEIHPGYSQEAACAYCFENEVRPQAWSPLGRGGMIGNDLIAEYAEKYGKSVAQICLRFLLEKGIIPLVKASSKERMLQNLDVFDFSLEKEDVQILSCMPQNTWLGEHPDFAIPKKNSNFDQ